jgi:hypothetical protein
MSSTKHVLEEGVKRLLEMVKSKKGEITPYQQRLADEAQAFLNTEAEDELEAVRLLEKAFWRMNGLVAELRKDRLVVA